ncbi:MAG: hypothetical protein WCO71_05035 [Pseudomonadota bacterium]
MLNTSTLKENGPNKPSGRKLQNVQKARSSCLDDEAAHSVLRADAVDATMDKLFDTLPKLMRPEQFAEHFGYSVATIYDWRYRGVIRGVPSGLFLTLNRRLYIRTDIFWTWVASQNPDVESGTK